MKDFKNLIVEFTGTFFVMFTAGNVIVARQPLAALAIGATLMVATYAGFGVSGAHYNPLISLGMWRRGRLPTRQLPFYILVQMAAALAAAWLANVVQTNAVQTFLTLSWDANWKGVAQGHAQSTLALLLAEFIPSFMLMFIAMHVTAKREIRPNQYFGLAIGAAYFIGITISQDVSGGLLNPAVSLGLCLMKLKKWYILLFLWPAQFAGGYLAAEIFHRAYRDPLPLRDEEVS